MGLIHTPRTLVAIGRGLIKRSLADPKAPTHIGIGEMNRHVYKARLGLVDVDYLGHMNNGACIMFMCKEIPNVNEERTLCGKQIKLNLRTQRNRAFALSLSTYFSPLLLSDITAAYLTHAELARWEMTGYNGMLSAMYKHKVNYLVASTAIRFRQEIRPFFRQFQIDTTVCGLDSRSIWISHKFRYPAKDDTHPESRILAQVIVRGVTVSGRTVLEPAQFLKEQVGMDTNLIDSLVLSHSTHEADGVTEQLLERYVALEDAFKESAAKDDKQYQA